MPIPEPCELTVKQYDHGDIRIHISALTGYCLGYGDIYYRSTAGVGLSLCIDGVYVWGNDNDNHYHATPRDALRAAILCMRDHDLDVRRVVFDVYSVVGVLV